MAKFKTRRLNSNRIQLVGRSPEDYAQELQEWLKKLWEQVSGGIPPGFNNTAPSKVQAGIAGSAGTESAGWMAADAKIPIETGPPSAILLGMAAAEGTGTPLARADHIGNTIGLSAQIRALVSLRVG